MKNERRDVGSCGVSGRLAARLPGPWRGQRLQARVGSAARSVGFGVGPGSSGRGAGSWRDGAARGGCGRAMQGLGVQVARGAGQEARATQGGKATGATMNSDGG